MVGHTRLVEEAEGVLSRGWQPGQAFQAEVEYLSWELKTSEGLDDYLSEQIVICSRDLAALIERGDRSASMPAPAKGEIIQAGPKPIPHPTPASKGPKQAITQFNPLDPLT